MVFRSRSQLKNGKVVVSGSLRLDIRAQSLTKPNNRIQRNTGVFLTAKHAERTFLGIKQMVKELDAERDIPRLLQIQRGEVDLLSAYKDYQLGRAEFLSFKHTPFIPAYEKWVASDKDAQSPRTQRNRLQVVQRLVSLGCVDDDTGIHQLPDAMLKCQEAYKGTGNAAAFSKIKSYIVQFLTSAKGVGADHPVTKACRVAVGPSKSSRRKHYPFKSPRELAELLLLLNEKTRNEKDPHTYAEIFSFMIWHGLRPRELTNGQWERDKGKQATGQLRIHGTKTQFAERVVPMIEYLTPMQRSWAALHQRLLKLGVRYRMQDMRRTYSIWLRDAKIERSHIFAYMGHDVRGDGFLQTDTYQEFSPEHDPDAVELDRQKIVAWRDEQLAKTPLKRKSNWAPSSKASVASQIAAIKSTENS